MFWENLTESEADELYALIKKERIRDMMDEKEKLANPADDKDLIRADQLRQKGWKG
jgi:hypothetical protein